MLLIKNALIVNEMERYKANVLIKGERIVKILKHSKPDDKHQIPTAEKLKEIIDAEGLMLFPGIIDAHVHFREPGMTRKGDIHSESRAGIAGGVTSFIDMPNTIPQTVTAQTFRDKLNLAAKSSMANYAFMFGITNDNIKELENETLQSAIALKVFMGASTGNMLVDNPAVLEKIFAETDKIIVAHCESETIIARNKAYYVSKYGENLNVAFHPKIRSAEACYVSSAEAIRLATKYNSRLHIAHLSTEKELSLLSGKPLNKKHITAEASIHHLWFTDKDYSVKGNLIKWNPAIKSPQDREALRSAIVGGKIDIVATDHAPHTIQEKQGPYLTAASGGPMIQHSLVTMLELCRKGIFTEEIIVDKMAHNPARLFNIKDRGFIREGYYADLVLINPDAPWTVDVNNILYKCKWSPMDSITFSSQIEKTFVNGHIVYDRGLFDEDFIGKAF
jgi:dihydroorotase